MLRTTLIRGNTLLVRMGWHTIGIGCALQVRMGWHPIGIGCALLVRMGWVGMPAWYSKDGLGEVYAPSVRMGRGLVGKPSW